MIASLYRLGRDLREGRAAAGALTHQCLERLAATDHRLGAYRLATSQIARDAAAAADAAFACGADPGPLAGIPVSIKDLYGMRGLDSYAGSPRPVPPQWQAEGPLVRLLRDQLAVPVGKTHTVEFAFGGLGVNSHWGTPMNPWDMAAHRVPGGSSAGAGVSLVQGSALVALGTDTAGSVRIPASMTGTVGLKTSYGRWPLAGIFPLSPSLDTAGILARTVEDVAFAFAAMDPYVEESPWQFVDALRRERDSAPVLGEGEPALWEACDDAVITPVIEALAVLERAGATRVDAPLPEAATAQELLRKGNVVSAEIAELLASEMPEWLDTLDPLVGTRIRDGGSISAAEWLSRKRQLGRLARASAGRFDNCEVMVCPTVTIPVPTLDSVSELDGYRSANMACLHNTCAGNSLDLCALSMPAGADAAGMPVGLQLIAPHGAEEELLSAALWIEDHIGGAAERLGRPPEVPA